MSCHIARCFVWKPHGGLVIRSGRTFVEEYWVQSKLVIMQVANPSNRSVQNQNFSVNSVEPTQYRCS